MLVDLERNHVVEWKDLGTLMVLCLISILLLLAMWLGLHIHLSEPQFLHP